MMEKKIRLGVCAMEAKINSKPMQAILERINQYNDFEIILFEEKLIMEQDISTWPIVDCLVSFFSNGFPLDKAIAYADKYNPIVLNDLRLMRILRNRRDVYRLLQEAKIPTANYLVIDHIAAKESPSAFVETYDYIVYNGIRLNKPFVEKPINADNHNIWIYYPRNAGGGVKKLFRKIKNKASAFHPALHEVRKDNVYIYEEFLATYGTDIKVYTVGEQFAHAEARKSPALDGIVLRANDGKEIRYPVLLTEQEKLIAFNIVKTFSQFVCGFDILRTKGSQPVVCDVNGWSFVKGNDKYYHDCSHIIRESFLRKFYDRYNCLPMRTYSITDNTNKNMKQKPWDVSKFISRTNSRFIKFLQEAIKKTFADMDKRDNANTEEELRVVVVVMRHGDRKPKQKIKFETQNPFFLSHFQNNNTENKEELKYKSPEELYSLLETVLQVQRDQTANAPMDGNSFSKAFPNEETQYLNESIHANTGALHVSSAGNSNTNMSNVNQNSSHPSTTSIFNTINPSDANKSPNRIDEEGAAMAEKAQEEEKRNEKYFETVKSLNKSRKKEKKSIQQLKEVLQAGDGFAGINRKIQMKAMGYSYLLKREYATKKILDCLCERPCKECGSSLFLLEDIISSREEERMKGKEKFYICLNTECHRWRYLQVIIREKIFGVSASEISAENLSEASKSVDIVTSPQPGHSHKTPSEAQESVLISSSTHQLTSRNASNKALASSLNESPLSADDYFIGSSSGKIHDYNPLLSNSSSAVQDDEDLGIYTEIMDIDRFSYLEEFLERKVNKILIVAKSGGELTTIGSSQAEDLGVRIRISLYPNGDTDGLLRLHSTFRHDLKIYSSDEGRCQLTSAAFTKGLLDLEGALTPILVQLVIRDNKAHILLDDSSPDTVRKEVKKRLKELLLTNVDINDNNIHQFVPSHLYSDGLKDAIRKVKNPYMRLVEIYNACQKFVEKLMCEINTVEKIFLVSPCNNTQVEETLKILEEVLHRWNDIIDSFYNKKAHLFCPSKLSNIIDNIRYDLIHYHQNLGQSLFAALTIQMLADDVANYSQPQEYGLTEEEKVRIGVSVVTKLMQKILRDLTFWKQESQSPTDLDASCEGQLNDNVKPMPPRPLTAPKCISGPSPLVAINTNGINNASTVNLSMGRSGSPGATPQRVQLDTPTAVLSANGLTKGTLTKAQEGLADSSTPMNQSRVYHSLLNSQEGENNRSVCPYCGDAKGKISSDSPGNEAEGNVGKVEGVINLSESSSSKGNNYFTSNNSVSKTMNGQLKSIQQEMSRKNTLRSSHGDASCQHHTTDSPGNSPNARGPEKTLEKYSQEPTVLGPGDGVQQANKWKLTSMFTAFPSAPIEFFSPFVTTNTDYKEFLPDNVIASPSLYWDDYSRFASNSPQSIQSGQSQDITRWEKRSFYPTLDTPGESSSARQISNGSAPKSTYSTFKKFLTIHDSSSIPAAKGYHSSSSLLRTMKSDLDFTKARAPEILLSPDGYDIYPFSKALSKQPLSSTTLGGNSPHALMSKTSSSQTLNNTVSKPSYTIINSEGMWAHQKTKKKKLEDSPTDTSPICPPSSSANPVTPGGVGSSITPGMQYLKSNKSGSMLANEEEGLGCLYCSHQQSNGSGALLESISDPLDVHFKEEKELKSKQPSDGGSLFHSPAKHISLEEQYPIHPTEIASPGQSTSTANIKRRPSNDLEGRRIPEDTPRSNQPWANLARNPSYHSMTALENARVTSKDREGKPNAPTRQNSLRDFSRIQYNDVRKPGNDNAEHIAPKLDEDAAAKLGIRSPWRNVRSRFYVTSASHLQSMLNILLLGHQFADGEESLISPDCTAANQITDIHYLSHIVLRLWEKRSDGNKPNTGGGSLVSSATSNSSSNPNVFSSPMSSGVSFAATHPSSSNVSQQATHSKYRLELLYSTGSKEGIYQSIDLLHKDAELHRETLQTLLRTAEESSKREEAKKEGKEKSDDNGLPVRTSPSMPAGLEKELMNDCRKSITSTPPRTVIPTACMEPSEKTCQPTSILENIVDNYSSKKNGSSLVKSFASNSALLTSRNEEHSTSKKGYEAVGTDKELLNEFLVDSKATEKRSVERRFSGNYIYSPSCNGNGVNSISHSTKNMGKNSQICSIAANASPTLLSDQRPRIGEDGGEWNPQERQLMNIKKIEKIYSKNESVPPYCEINPLIKFNDNLSVEHFERVITKVLTRFAVTEKKKKKEKAGDSSDD